MTTLQIVLAIVGIGLVAAIVLYNVIQERRFRREADRLFSHKRDDVMLGEAVRTDSSHRPGEARIQLLGPEMAAPEAAHAVEVADDTFLGRHLDDGLSLEDGFTARQMDDDELPAPLGELPGKAEPVADAVQQAKPEAKPAPARKEAVKPADRPRPVVKPVASVEEAGFLPPHIAGLRTAETPRPQPAAPVPSPAKAAKPAVPVEEAREIQAKIPDVQVASSLDKDTEYVARLKFASPAFSSYSTLLGSLRRIGKPVRAFGLRSDGIWEVLTANSRNAYSQMELGLQLADRSGAVAQDQLDAFCRALYTFAADAGGAVTCPDKEAALARAQELDLFCMDVDVLMGLNVIAVDGHLFTSEAIHTQALAAGMVLERDGVYHMRNAGGNSLFTLANQEDAPFPQDGRGLTTQGVTLLFDVPRVSDGVVVFDRMTEFGRALADRLYGRLVDDNSRAVSGDSLVRDRGRLQHFFQRMAQHGIPAGGERALRLFA